jgi:1,4-dihydroxy-2-naphthoate octaprenyltransferase
MADENPNWVGMGIAAVLVLIGIAAIVGAYRYGFAGIGSFASSIFWWVTSSHH